MPHYKSFVDPTSSHSRLLCVGSFLINTAPLGGGMGLASSREGPTSSFARTWPPDHGCIEMRIEIISSSFSPQLHLGKD